jgi:hypothetical protein
MKLRCPYCKKFYERPASRCPHCNRLAVLPTRLRKTTFRQRENMRARIERKADHQRRRQPGVGAIHPGRDPRIIILAMFVLVVCGALLFHRSSNIDENRIPIDQHLQMVLIELEAMRVAAERFHLDVGRYPTPEEGPFSLVQRPEGLTNWGGHYVTVVTPDPWKIPYHFSPASNELFTITSSGPDKTLGTPDDIPSDPLHEIVERQLLRYAYTIERFRSDTGRYPKKMEGLRALVRDPQVPDWGGPYMKYRPRDPWKRDYYYMPHGNTYDLRSMGPDQRPHTEDDILPPAPDPTS